MNKPQTPWVIAQSLDDAQLPSDVYSASRVLSEQLGFTVAPLKQDVLGTRYLQQNDSYIYDGQEGFDELEWLSEGGYYILATRNPQPSLGEHLPLLDFVITLSENDPIERQTLIDWRKTHLLYAANVLKEAYDYLYDKNLDQAVLFSVDLIAGDLGNTIKDLRRLYTLERKDSQQA